MGSVISAIVKREFIAERTHTNYEVTLNSQFLQLVFRPRLSDR